MPDTRDELIRKIEAKRNSKVILYVTSDRFNMATNIAGDVIDLFGEHLEKLNGTKRVSLILHTLGGNTLAAWNIVNMIREYTDYLEVIVLNKARSAGTLISLGANTIIMTNQSTLGPIDPSLTTPLNPVDPNSNPKRLVPISVESVKGYIDFAKTEMNVKRGKDFKQIYNSLSDKVHPVVIGSVYRSKAQIQMLAKKLLNTHFSKFNIIKRKKIIKFLCSDSGSHDYTINKTEAINLGLPVVSADNETNELINQLYINVKKELLLDKPYDPIKYIGTLERNSYKFIRGLIESSFGGKHQFISEGELFVQNINGQKKLQDNRNKDEWSKIL
ncbi:MAG: hypothetical protein WC964_02420 [Acholeplasmataceae bacterium]